MNGDSNTLVFLQLIDHVLLFCGFEIDTEKQRNSEQLFLKDWHNNKE